MTTTEIKHFDVQVRAAADPDAREFEGIAVPWNQEIDIYGIRETFAPGSVVESDDIVFYRHLEPIGRIRSSVDTDAGWRVVGTIAKTSTGDEAYTLLREGVISHLSVYFVPLEWTQDAESGLITYTKVRVREVSLVPFPAYSEAAIESVRSEPNPDNSNPSEGEITVPETLTAEDLERSLTEQREEFTRSMDSRFAQFTPHTDQTPELQWRSAGAFVQALAQGDEEAHAFYRQFNANGEEGDDFRRAYTGGVTGDGPMPNTWIQDAIRLIATRRRIVNLFQHETLPPKGNTLEYAKLKSNSIVVGKQANEGDDLPKGKIEVDSAFATVGTYGGWSELSFQQIERSSIPFLNLTYQAQTLEYARQVELAARTALLSQINTQTTAGNKIDMIAAPTKFSWLDAIVDAADIFEDRGYNLEGALVSKDVFKELMRLEDTNGRLLFNVQGEGVNQIGTLNLKGPSGSLANVEFGIVKGAAAKTGVFFDSLAMTTWESAGAPVQLQDSNIINLSKQFSVYGYAAFGSQHPQALLPIKRAAA